MPKLHSFRIERKACSEKSRKSTENVNKRPQFRFARLLQFSNINLPLELQNFISSERQLSNGDFSRNNISKIRVVLKINESKDTPSCLTFNKNQNCVGLIDPTPSRRSHTSNNNINLFPFDSIFTESDQQSTLLSSSIIDPILDFFKGRDACIFSFGNSGLGKTTTMVGSDQSLELMGVIPYALLWVFKVMEQLKLNKKTRYAIRISALEIANKNVVRDLLANSSSNTINIGTENVSSCTSNPGVFLLEKSSMVLNNQKELPAGSLLEAANILDSVFASRSTENSSLTHLQFVIHLYQYQLDNNQTESVNKQVLGGRSRLHFLDLGSGRHGNDDASNLSLQGMSKVILALYTSQRHIPYKDNMLTQLLKDTLSVNTVTTMLVHISNKEQNYNETLQIVQLASKLYRTRSRKSRSVGFLVSDETSSCSSSSSGFHSRRLRPHMGIGAARRSSGNSSASSELDLTSTSELSCCETVIFKGNVNVSGSEKSLDQKNLKSESSESDLVFSDKELSNDYISSSSNLWSPSSIRRRRISPRTNARAWPSSNSGLNTSNENAPELWVDGPNAVYKSDQKQQVLSESVSSKVSLKESSFEPLVPNIKKPVTLSKETQCDDVWDSSSSLTDGSSHSNTLDRKDHRPLSDISECTEETESNLTTEAEIVKMNIMNEMYPINDFDDLLESTFGLTTFHHETEPKLSEKENHNYINASNSQPLCQILKEKENKTSITISGTLEHQNTKTINISPNIEVAKIMPVIKNIEISKQYHSATDSKRSTKSEQKERKSKSKCKKCTKKTSDELAKSLSSSNSTDFSRISSWIQKVEYDIQSSSNENNANDAFFDNRRQYGYYQHSHHQSQPDISYQRDKFSSSKSIPLQHPVPFLSPLENNWVQNDFNQVQYSLYGAYQIQPTITTEKSFQKPIVKPIMTYGSELAYRQHVLPQNIAATVQPLHSPQMTRRHVQSANIFYNRHSVSITQPPLPPLPQEKMVRDNRVSFRNNIHAQKSCESEKLNPSPKQLIRHPKCKTLPRDMYLDPVSPLKRNKSDIHPSKAAQYKDQSLLSTYDNKSKEKIRKEPKNIMSILFAPFISLRNKINKSKCNSDRQTTCSENDTEKSLSEDLETNRLREPEWSSVNIKDDPQFVLPSPYHLVTPPKTAMLPTESSGHGSDCSSFQNRVTTKIRSSEISRQQKCRNKCTNNNSKNTTRQRPTSSGYGSIIIKGDSEVSSHNDSSSEYSISGNNNNTKLLTSQNRIKHSLSFSNCKSALDITAISTGKAQRTDSGKEYIVPNINDNAKLKSITTAQDLILHEKLRISLSEERKIVMEYIEANRLRGLPVDACVMNMICFKGVDNFEISSSLKRDECKSIIEQIGHEVEQLKHKRTQAQNNLLLITTFDSVPTSIN